ncbi:hypothetical protein B0H16DRAFT_1513519, partial [Mycena metata]
MSLFLAHISCFWARSVSLGRISRALGAYMCRRARMRPFGRMSCFGPPSAFTAMYVSLERGRIGAMGVWSSATLAQR